MAIVKPFTALLPDTNRASEICELPYDVMSTAEAVGVQRAAERAERPPPSREEAESAALERRERKARAKRGKAKLRLSKHARAKARAEQVAA